MTKVYLTSILVGLGLVSMNAAALHSPNDFTAYQKEGIARRSSVMILPDDRVPRSISMPVKKATPSGKMPLSVRDVLRSAREKQQEKMDSVIRTSITGTPVSLQKFTYTDRGQYLRADNYIAGADGKWQIYNYFNYEYDSMGRLVMCEQVVPDDMWSNIRYEYGYDDDTDFYSWELFYYPDWETGELMPSQKGEYKYDSEGRPVEQIFYYWNSENNDWQLVRGETVSFDDLGRQTSYYSYVPNEDGTALIGSEGETYMYVGDTETDAEVDGFIWENDGWLKYLRHVYTYENGHLTKNEFLYWNRANQDWSGNDTFGPYEILQRNVYTDYEYDDQGRLTSTKAYSMNSNGVYVNNSIDSYTYSQLDNGEEERIHVQEAMWQGPYLSTFKREIQHFNVFGAETYYKNYTYTEGSERAVQEEVRDIDDKNIYHGGTFYEFTNDEANTRYGSSKEEFGYPADWDGVNETPSYGMHWTGTSKDSDDSWLENRRDEFTWHDIYLIGNTHYEWENNIQHRISSYLFTCDYTKLAEDIWAWTSTRENIPYKLLEFEQYYDSDMDGEWDTEGYAASYLDRYFYSDVNSAVENIRIVSDCHEVERYDLYGRRLSAPQTGINIVKYSDGSVKKIVVR